MIKEHTKFNDLEEFAMSISGADSQSIKKIFDESCTVLLQTQIYELSKDGSLQSAIREIGNWFNSPSLQNFNLE